MVFACITQDPRVGASVTLVLGVEADVTLNRGVDDGVTLGLRVDAGVTLGPLMFFKGFTAKPRRYIRAWTILG